MTVSPRRSAVVVAALAVGGCLGAPAAAAQPVALPGLAAPARATAVADVVRLLRSDPADGAWTRTPPARVRLWFAGADGRTPTARVSTPRRPGMTDAAARWAGGVLTVQVPDDGPGEYRVVWFLVPAHGGSGTAAAGTVAYRVGAGAPAGGSKAFTIPPSPAGTTAAADATTATHSAEDAGTATTTAGPGTSSAAAAASTGSAPSTAPGAAGPTRGPTDGAAVPVRRNGFRFSAPSPADLAGLALAGLLALACGAAWSVRAGSRAAARAR